MFKGLTLPELLSLFGRMHRAFNTSNTIASASLIFTGVNDLSERYEQLTIDLWSIHTDLYQQIESVYDDLASGYR